jgi:hypothetical protein
MIPAFRADGSLPVGRHVGTPSHVEQRLVQSFPQSVTRRALHRGWRDRREELQDLVGIEVEWLNGSFASSKRDPADIDLTTFIDAARLEAVSEDDRKRILDLVQGLGAWLTSGCHGFLVPVRPEGHALRYLYEQARDGWERWWSHDRSGADKGFVEVREAP